MTTITHIDLARALTNLTNAIGQLHAEMIDGSVEENET